MLFLDILKKIGQLLTPAERRGMLALFSCILVTAFLEVAGVASVMPFMAVVANPSLIRNNQHLLYLGHAVGLDDSRSFVLFLGAVALFLLV